MTYRATFGSYSTCCSKVSTETPSQWVSNLVHLVTQLMSTVGVSWGKAISSSQVQRFGSCTFPTIEKSHRSRGVCGVGPAESIGKPRSRYCPGGSRPATSGCWRRPRNPREMNPSLMFYPSIALVYRSLLHSTTCSGVSFQIVDLFFLYVSVIFIIDLSLFLSFHISVVTKPMFVHL